MPIIAYGCECKHVSKKFYRNAGQAPAFLICDKCQKEMKRLLAVPSSTSKITVDNGIQARAVEINPEIVALNEERSNKNYRED